MTDFSSVDAVALALTNAQDDDYENRQRAREAHQFIEERDGQWEPDWWTANEGRPRYTFDKTGPMVDQVAGDLEESDFNITILPASGEASKDTAKTMDGLIRNIEAISNATDIYHLAGRNMVCAGLDGWQIKQRYIDADSFDQDLVIEPVANFIDSVWFGPFKKPDASDANYAFLLEAIDLEAYEKRWPDGKAVSVAVSKRFETTTSSTDSVIVGQVFYIDETPRELLLMSSGRVLENTEETRSVLDELLEAGDSVIMERNRPKRRVKTRLFDGGGWLGAAQDTVFSIIPLVPVFVNFKILDNKLLYRGLVEKQMDPQRVFNYATSREVEEGALAPRGKYWATPEQTAGHEKTLATLNTNADPVQLYNIDPRAAANPPPFIPGGTINPGLQSISASMNAVMQQTAGLFASSMGDNPGLQSGIAIKRLQNRGDTGTVKFFRAMERSIGLTGRILVDAAPRVYDTPRLTRLLQEDGSYEMVTLNQQVTDQQTGRLVTLNDVSKGAYSVLCVAGPAFRNRQEETVAAITEMAAVDPSIIELGGDILFNNLTTPGMDLLGARKRAQLLKAGLIPEDQLTDDEIAAQQQAAQQPPPPDAAMVLAQAEAAKAEAQNNKVMIEAQAIERREARADFKADQDRQAQQFDQMMKMQTSLVQRLSDQAKTLKVLSDALGVVPGGGPVGVAAVLDQARLIGQAQDQQ